MRDSVTNFYYTNGEEFLEEGYQKIQDVPKNLLDNGNKTGKKRVIQKEAHEKDKEILQDEQLKNFIHNLTYPIHYLDFEAYNPKRKKVSHLPFQHSLHIQEENGRIRHFEFLGRQKDPRNALRNDLQKIIQNNGSIVVYNQRFESKILNQLNLDQFTSRLEDLWMPFKEFWYYHPDQAGRTGLKTVYPIVTNNNEYKGLDVKNGKHAQERYRKMLATGFSRSKREGLLRYCAMDTYSMIDIIDKIKEKV